MGVRASVRRSFVRSLVRWFVRPFVRSIVRLVGRSALPGIRASVQRVCARTRVPLSEACAAACAFADGVIISHYVDGLTCAISALTFTFALLAHVIFLECAITALNIQHALLRHFDICTCAINAR